MSEEFIKPIGTSGKTFPGVEQSNIACGDMITRNMSFLDYLSIPFLDRPTDISAMVNWRKSKFWSWVIVHA